MDLEKMTLKELRDLRSKVDRAISSFEDRRRREAIAAAEEVARAHGFNLAELTGASSRAQRKSGRGVAKYSHPEDSSITWSGRGRRPKWVNDQLDAGKTLEDLAI